MDSGVVAELLLYEEILADRLAKAGVPVTMLRVFNLS